MERCRVTVDRRVDGQTVESETSAEMENYIGMLFSHDKDNPKCVKGEILIKGVFKEMEIHVFANMCADALLTLTEDRSDAPVIWSKFLQTIIDRTDKHVEDGIKKKTSEFRDHMQAIGLSDEEIDKMLDMMKAAAHEGAEALRASRATGEGGD